MSNLQEVLNELAALLEQADSSKLDALIAIRGMISKRIGELENTDNSVEVAVEAEGTVEVPAE